jgi:hypothetical protein
MGSVSLSTTWPTTRHVLPRVTASSHGPTAEPKGLPVARCRAAHALRTAGIRTRGPAGACSRRGSLARASGVAAAPCGAAGRAPGSQAARHRISIEKAQL